MAEIAKTMTIGGSARRRDELSSEPVQGSRWTVFKNTFSCTLSRIFLASLFCFIFCIPAVAWVIVFSTLFISRVGTSFPYGAYDGLGYVVPGSLTEGLDTANVLGTMRYYQYALIEFGVLVPCIVVGAIGIGGLVYMARNAAHRSEIKVVSTFFTGVKYTWLRAAIGGLLVGACIFLVMFCAYVFDAYALGLGGKIVTMIFSIALLVLVSIYSFYLVTLSANYEMPLGATMKDALVLTLKRMPSNLLSAVFASLIIGLAFLFILLFGSSTFGALFWFLLFFVGFYAICGVFVSFDQAAFEKYINEDMAERETRAKTEESYAAIRAAKAAGERPAKKQNAQPAKYVNPKKKKKQEGAKPEKPAPSSAAKGGYSAEELSAMEEDRKKLLSETHEVSVDDFDMSAYEDDDEK